MSRKDKIKEIAEKIRNIVGDEYVSDSLDVLLAYSVTASIGFDSYMPDLVVRPSNTEEIAEIVKIANEYRVPIVPRGGGTGLQAEALARRGGIILDLTRMDKILDISEENLSVTVEAGVTFGKLDKALIERGLWFPIYPESSLSATIAGNVAVNGAGPGSALYGCIGEQVLGLKVVLPTGEVITTGSMANPNSPGHYLRYAFGPDITGLFIGSLGAFGVITEVALKIYKRPEEFRHVTYGFEKAKGAMEFLRQLLLNNISVLHACIYEGDMLTFFIEFLGEEYGIPQIEWPPYVVSLTIGGRKDVVEHDYELMESIVTHIGGRNLNVPQFPRGEWMDRMRVYAKASYMHPFYWRILYHHAPIMRWDKAAEAIREILEKYGLLGHTSGLMSGRSYNFYPHLYFYVDDKEAFEKVKQAHAELASKLLKIGCVPFKLAPYWIGEIKKLREYYDFLRKIKRVLDPNNIMNPGVFLED